MSGGDDRQRDRPPAVAHQLIDGRRRAVRVELAAEHKVRFEDVPGGAVLQAKLGRIQLHRPIGRLVVEGGHLHADVPHRNRVVVAGVETRSARVDARELVAVVGKQPTAGGPVQPVRYLILRQGDHLRAVCYWWWDSFVFQERVCKIVILVRRVQDRRSRCLGRLN